MLRAFLCGVFFNLVTYVLYHHLNDEYFHSRTVYCTQMTVNGEGYT